MLGWVIFDPTFGQHMTETLSMLAGGSDLVKDLGIKNGRTYPQNSQVATLEEGVLEQQSFSFRLRTALILSKFLAYLVYFGKYTSPAGLGFFFRFLGVD